MACNAGLTGEYVPGDREGRGREATGRRRKGERRCCSLSQRESLRGGAHEHLSGSLSLSLSCENHQRFRVATLVTSHNMNNLKQTDTAGKSFHSLSLLFARGGHREPREFTLCWRPGDFVLEYRMSVCIHSSSICLCLSLPVCLFLSIITLCLLSIMCSWSFLPSLHHTTPTSRLVVVFHSCCVSQASAFSLVFLCLPTLFSRVLHACGSDVRSQVFVMKEKKDKSSRCAYPLTVDFSLSLCGLKTREGGQGCGRRGGRGTDLLSTPHRVEPSLHHVCVFLS